MTVASTKSNNGTPQTKTLMTEFDGEKWLDEALTEAAGRLTRIRENCAKAVRSAPDPTLRALFKSAARKRIVAVLTDPVMNEFMELMGEPYGFYTDRDWGNSKYDKAVVKKCLIAAFLAGLSPYNQEFNIIKGKMMPVLNGYRRKLRDLEGLENFPKLNLGLPVECGKSYRVPFRADWVYNGKADFLEGDRYIKRDFDKDGKETSTIDNVLGRAERKALKAILIQICGTDEGDIDESDISEEDATPKPTQAAPQAQTPPAQKPAAEPPPADAMDDRKALEKRCTDAYKVAFDAKKITDQGFKSILETKWQAKSRTHMNAAQLRELAEYLEGLTRERQPGDEGDDNPADTLPFEGNESDAYADRR